MREHPRPTRQATSKRTRVVRWLALLSLIAGLTLTGVGVVKYASANIRAVIPGCVYRSGQPTPERLRTWIERYGIATIVNLRGPKAPLAAEEREVAAAVGVSHFEVGLSAYELIPPEKLRQLIEILETAQTPILLHCWHGVDRAGTASALAAWLLGGQPYRKAKWQAYVPPGPWKHRHGPHHVSDTLALYERYCRDHDFNPDDPVRFKNWAKNVYAPETSPTMRTCPENSPPLGGSGSVSASTAGSSGAVK